MSASIRRQFVHRRQSWRPARRLFFEPLESRTLLTVTGHGLPDMLTTSNASAAAVVGSAVLDNGTLTVEGTSRSDVIVLTQDRRGRVEVVLNGRRQGPFEASQVVVDGLAGHDVLRAAGKFLKPLEMRGGDGNDQLTGGRGADRLSGEAGNDVLRGNAGDDVLDGGEGRDTLHGDNGNDELLGEAGNDALYGGKGNDELDGGAGADELHGHDGHDTLRGGSGNDRQFGGAGKDVAFGDQGDDSLDGGAGDDILSAGSGSDRLYGQAGRDLLIGGDGADRLESGGQDDILIAGQTLHDADPQTLAAALARWTARGSYFSRVNAVTGSALAAELRLDTSTVIDDQDVDRVLGGGGADLFYAVAGDKVLDRGKSETIWIADNLTLPLVNRAVVAKDGVQQMPSVAVNPHDPSHVVIAYMDYSLPTADTNLPGEGYAGIGVAVSKNGGHTWQSSSIPLRAGFDQGAANPIAKFDGEGRLYVSFMSVTFLGTKPPLTNPDKLNPTRNASDREFGFQANNGIFVARSDDGGQNWNQPVPVVSNLYDGQTPVFFEDTPDLAIDSFRFLPNGQPNPRYGNLYVTWTRAYPPGRFPGQPDATGGTDAMLAVSRDSGQTWQDPGGTDFRTAVIQNRINTGVGATPGLGQLNQSRLAIGPEGDIYASNWAGNDFAVYHSTDGGASFVGPNHQEDRYLAFGTGFVSISATTFPNNHFRTNLVRAIVADPTRPGHVYAAEASIVIDPIQSRVVDQMDIFFARSTNYGETWQRTTRVGPNTTRVLNDENDGRAATGLSVDEIISGQAMPRLTVDAQGNIAVIWYDTRRDPANHLLDVLGVVSTDGGQTFSPNFRVTDVSFDADDGAFIDATGQTNFYLGDLIGLSAVNNTAYGAWTDTRQGNQDIFFARYSLDPPPAPPNDRFEPNNTAPAATNVGPLFRRFLPKLALPAGDVDWFRVQALATGNLTVSAVQAEPGKGIQLELWDETGVTLLARGADLGDANGSVTGQQTIFPGSTGRTYLVRVSQVGTDGSRPIDYSLNLQSLTADLGTRVNGFQNGTLAPGDSFFYLLTAGAAGSLEFKLTSGANVLGNLNLELLDPDTRTVLTSGQASGNPGPGEIERANLAVKQGQAVLLRVFGDVNTQGDFQLDFTNFDQFTSTENLFLPDGLGPSSVALGDLNRDGNQDLVIPHTLSNTISVFLGNGDGTFQAPRLFDIGAFAVSLRGVLFQNLPSYGRDVAVAHLNDDLFPDVVVTNYASADISVLLGRGDGTFEPQRRFDATTAPIAVAVGNLGGDPSADLVVIDSPEGPQITAAALIGRGDGTFHPQQTHLVPSGGGFPPGNVRLADFNNDGKADVGISGRNQFGILILLANGDGTFRDAGIINADVFISGNFDVGDINGDDRLDIVTTNALTNNVSVLLGNGDGTFRDQDEPQFFTGQLPFAVAIADVGSRIILPDGTPALGPRDGQPDLVVANTGVVLFLESVSPPGVVVLPGLRDAQGFAGFGSPMLLSVADGPLDVAVGNINGDTVPDIAIVDRDGVRILFGAPPIIVANNTPETARDLGTVVHLVQPTLTITPAQSESWFKFKVPKEATAGSGDQILDISTLIEYAEGAGLGVELRNSAGNVVASGSRTRTRLPQEAEMFLRVFARPDAQGQLGAAAYTLVLNVLPQVVSVESQFLLPGVGNVPGASTNVPGGPTTSIVLTLQGDRLDPAAAQNKANYRVTWLGPNGAVGGGDDQVIPLASGASAVVYSPSSNVEILTGTRFPTAVHQTVTLLFDQPLPAGSYQIEVLPAVQTEDFNSDEDALLSGGAATNGHPIVQVSDTNLAGGVTLTAANLVVAPGALAPDFSAFEQGSEFLAQLHDDLAAILDGTLTALGDDPNLSQTINDNIRKRITAALAQTAVQEKFLVVWLDPGGFDLEDPPGDTISYDIGEDELSVGIDNVFVDVIGNIEIIVLAALDGIYDFSVADLGGQARGGFVLVGADGNTEEIFTDELRSGTTKFQIDTSGDS